MTPSRTSRLGLGWAAVRDSLWFVPSLAVAIGGALAIIAVQIPTPRAESRFAFVWLFGGGAEGARGVLSAIAGSLITVTGVVFSVTIVALQLASSQFTPRVLRSFVADRVNQVVLGIFIGTFTYTLLVLRTIHSTGEGTQVFVPQIGVIIALVLLLVSVGALIVFISHAARSVQASVILHRETQHALERITHLFPERVGAPVPRDRHGQDASHGATADRGIEVPSEPPACVTAAEAGYLQSVDADTLWRACGPRQPSPMLIRMELHIGAFAIPGKPLASVWPSDAMTEDVERGIREAFVLGDERTPEQDPEYGLVALSDIAVRALSPGVNDPTTAMHCVDRLGEVLAALASREHPAVLRTSPDGSMRLLVRDTPFDRALGLAFDQIRHFGADNPTIAKRMIETMHDLLGVAPVALHEALAAQVRAVARAARRAIDESEDLELVERLAEQALARAEEPRAASDSFSRQVVE